MSVIESRHYPTRLGRIDYAAQSDAMSPIKGIYPVQFDAAAKNPAVQFFEGLKFREGWFPLNAVREPPPLGKSQVTTLYKDQA